MKVLIAVIVFAILSNEAFGRRISRQTPKTEDVPSGNTLEDRYGSSLYPNINPYPYPPNSFPYPPNTFPYPPNTYPYPPNTFPYPPNTYPYPPNTFPYPPNTFPVLPNNGVPTVLPTVLPTTAVTTSAVNTSADCIRACPVTTEYNPVCGTNLVLYENPSRLQCATDCGISVTLLRTGACPPTTTAAPAS